jgi:hypothetical protein
MKTSRARKRTVLERLNAPLPPLVKTLKTIFELAEAHPQVIEGKSRPSQVYLALADTLQMLDAYVKHHKLAAPEVLDQIHTDIMSRLDLHPKE